MPPEILRVKNLSYSYHHAGHKVPVLKGVDLHVRKGEWLAICGPSGSGKSTLLYLLSGLLSSDKAKIWVDGLALDEVTDLCSFRAQHIGLIFQQFHLLPGASVWENIVLPAQYLEEGVTEKIKNRAKDLAQTLGLSDRLNHMPNELSGGQQQRVAIARALLLNPTLILADEPTGNLDSATGESVLEIFRQLKEEGHSLVMITHGADVAKKADRIVYLKDGLIVGEEKREARVSNQEVETKHRLGEERKKEKTSQVPWKLLINTTFSNIKRNIWRSLLTTIGVFIGVASVCAMITLGRFTKKKVLESYATLGVNTLQISGYPNWEQKATDLVPAQFRFFQVESDLKPLKRIFPQIDLISPTAMSWQGEVIFGGKSVSKDVRVLGVESNIFQITGQKMAWGRAFYPQHILGHLPVCILGSDLAQQLFGGKKVYRQMVRLLLRSDALNCTVLGVLAPTMAKQEWFNPNMNIYLPRTFFQDNSSNFWEGQIKDVLFTMKAGVEIEKMGNALKKYFEKKYGKSIFFRVSSNSLLIAQMKKFLTLFTVLLSSIALISLFIGGMGLTNMMLVSLSERIREIGLKKALGATEKVIRAEFLLETTVLSLTSGLMGMLCGVGVSSSALWLAAKVTKKFSYELVLDPLSLGLSFFAIIVVAIVSGMIPAMKASKLEVIEALRSE